MTTATDAAEGLRAALARLTAARPRALLVLLGLALFLPGLAALPVLDRDEARFAQASAQMLESGDFLQIRFQDTARNNKPVGIYWLQAASTAVFSNARAREIWSYRLPSLIAAIAALLFTYAAGRALFDPETAFLGASLLGASLALLGEATIAKTDAALLAAICAGMAGLAQIYGAARRGGEAPRAAAYLFWGAMGVAILIKGPIGPMIFTLTILALRLAPPRPAFLKELKPLRGAGLAVAIAAPWLIAIGIATDGAFFTEGLGRDGLAKIIEGQESHGAPPGVYLALVWIGFWPAAFLLAEGLRRALAERASAGALFCLAWAVPAWAIFEASATKLPHYTLPLTPALALLAARAATAKAPMTGRWSAIARRAGASLAGLGGGVLAAALLFGSIAYGGPGAAGPALFAAAIIAVASAAIFALVWRGRTGDLRRSAALAIGLAVIVSWTTLAQILPRWRDLAVSTAISEHLEALGAHPLHSAGAAPAALVGYHEPSAVFLLGTQTRLTDIAGAIAYLAAAEAGAAAPVAAIEARQAPDFRAAARAAGLPLEELGAVRGLNYSRGQPVEIRFYRPRREARAP